MSDKFSKIKAACAPVRRGFSIIEVLFVVAITLIVTATLFAGGNNERKATADVEFAARQLAAEIRSLQNEALTGKQIGTDYVNRYIFTVTSATSYTINYDRKNADDTFTTIGTKSFNMPSNRVSFSGTPSFYFTAPLANLNPATTFIAISSTLSGGIFAYVCVSSSGNITDSKNATCT